MSPQEVEGILLIPACEPSEQPTGECTIRFAEGSVSYNGNTTNSTAMYTTADAYCINDSRVRLCEAGLWLKSVVFEEGELMGSLRMNETGERGKDERGEGETKLPVLCNVVCVNMYMYIMAVKHEGCQDFVSLCPPVFSNLLCIYSCH